MGHSQRPASIYTLFAVSGACGLTYQVLWARWLSLVLGNTVVSVSIVLSSFMLGLALGSAIAARTLPRVRRPLRVYALLEIAVGLFALAFPLLARGAQGVLALLIDSDSPRPQALAARAAVGFALLLVPTTLMGATLPQLTALLRRLAAPGRRWRLGLLYAVNTAGAALGSLLVSFVGIELVGIRQTTLLAALLNVVVGLMALRIDRRLPAVPAAEKSPGVASPATREVVLPLAILTASGAAALASEVLWTRWLEVLVGNSSYAFALMLVVYLMGIALGSALPSLVMERLRHLEGWLIATQLASAGWLLLAVPAFGALARSLANQTAPLTMARLLGVYAEAAALLLPSALLAGAVFPLATRLLARAGDEATGEQAGRAYAWNTTGAVIGALVGGWLIAPHFDFLEAMLVLAMGYAAITVLAAGLVATGGVAAGSGSAAKPIAVGVLLAALPLGALALWREQSEGGYDAHLRRAFPEARVLFHARGPQGVTTVLAGSDGDRFGSVLLVNATGMTRLVTATKLMAHLPLLAHPRPQNTLVICFGMGTTFRSAMSHGGRVTVVELMAEVLDAFPTFHPDAAAVRADPRGRLVVDDGRSFLQLTRQRFDVITIDPPPPIDAAGVNNLYSRDFALLAKSRLRPGGIFAHWIPYPRSAAGVADRRTFAMLLRSIADAFPYVYGITGLQPIGLHVLGSERPIHLDSERLRQRLLDSRVQADLDEWQRVPREWFAELRPLDHELLDAFPAVTDDRPRLEFDLIRLWRAGTPKPFHTVFW